MLAEAITIGSITTVTSRSQSHHGIRQEAGTARNGDHRVSKRAQCSRAHPQHVGVCGPYSVDLYLWKSREDR